MPPPLDDLLTYLASSPSPYHAVANAESRLAAAGFTALAERASWSGESVAGRRYVVRGGALIAWVATDPAPAERGLRIIGAHTDSPNLRVKPNPDTTSVGWRQLGVEVYGGVLANSWLDRDLGLSGRVVLRGGEERLVRVERPIARVAQLAIHLDREVNEKGLVLDKQTHLAPIIGLGDADPGAFGRFLAELSECEADDIVSWDVMLHDLTPPALLGLDEELLAAGRIDNLFSSWAAVTALVVAASRPTPQIPMIALFDHEEVGSASTGGAAGPLLESVIGRILHGLGLDTDDRARAMASSSCLSSDMAHAVHPNYADRHEPQHRPLPNKGPVLKVNVNQRYATDAASAAIFAEACARADVPMQTFVSRNSQPCGSTIGPITATRLGITTIDVGCAMLSMHSARELCGAHDAGLFLRALNEYYAR